MTTFLLVVTVIVALALIGVILIQRSEGGGLGIGNSQGVGAFMTGRGTATLLTRSTGVLAGLFMVLCLVLAVMNRGASSGSTEKDILAQPQTQPSSAQQAAKTPAPKPTPSPSH